MKVRLAYGTTGLDIEVDPALTTVVEPLHHAGAADETAVLRAALRRPVTGRPLRERGRPGQTVAISACDGTLPQPRHLMIPAVLAELDGIVRPEDVVILVATGTHRGNDPDELRRCPATTAGTGSRKRPADATGSPSRRRWRLSDGSSEHGSAGRGLPGPVIATCRTFRTRRPGRAAPGAAADAGDARMVITADTSPGADPEHVLRRGPVGQPAGGGAGLRRGAAVGLAGGGGRRPGCRPAGRHRCHLAGPRRG
ncbi:hypothetical protein P3T34_007600 [Kitasatospora sp. MAP12-44]|uniref:lactate racemase domain-containing protein n=1 Tax=Kitasatospora sp. MAP12-44 TaxID=3035099 RepID=UPI002474E196|nr:lactate racemase domain-containing protein [Kitasatospora sp. MAP12-44]MDH6115385.1 hypothetical protein [Kitasatospora sp. MAP12-44]